MLIEEPFGTTEITREIAKTKREEETISIYEREESMLAQITSLHVKQEMKQENTVVQTKIILS